MDGFDTSDNVIVIAASNLEELIDPALVRAGRFDKKIRIANPDTVDRESMILNFLDKGKSLLKINKRDINDIAKKTSGFSPADLKNMVNLALIRSLKNHGVLKMSCFDWAIERISTGVRRNLLGNSPNEHYQTAIRHVGMALVALNRPEHVNFSFISLRPENNIDGQFSTISQSERVFESASEILATIDTYLASRQAELVIFGRDKGLTTGSSKYLQSAGNLGYLYYQLFGEESNMVQGGKLELSVGDQTLLSEEKRADVDEKVIALIEHRNKVVRKEIQGMVGDLTEISEFLVHKQTLSKQQLMDLL